MVEKGLVSLRLDGCPGPNEMAGRAFAPRSGIGFAWTQREPSVGARSPIVLGLEPIKFRSNAAAGVYYLRALIRVGHDPLR